jgi:hypothetical protein
MGLKILEHLHTYDTAKMSIYWSLLGILYICYFLIFFGLYAVQPKFIQSVSIIFHLFVCLFLLWRFHPFREEYKLHPYDGNIIFAGAMLLFTNTVMVEGSSYITNPTTYFKKLLSI